MENNSMVLWTARVLRKRLCPTIASTEPLTTGTNFARLEAPSSNPTRLSAQDRLSRLLFQRILKQIHIFIQQKTKEKVFYYKLVRLAFNILELGFEDSRLDTLQEDECLGKEIWKRGRINSTADRKASMLSRSVLLCPKDGNRLYEIQNPD